jgi:hypothetical protein
MEVHPCEVGSCDDYSYASSKLEQDQLAMMVASKRDMHSQYLHNWQEKIQLY